MAGGKRRGADVLVDALKRAGITHIFALSGNHIMSVFDALYGSGIEVIHTRHEAACVHMADAYARLTGKVGVALVTGGQGFTNAAAGLPTALAADSPVLVLSGDTPTSEVGRGAFQELDQVAMSRPVTKFALRTAAPEDLGEGLMRAISTALSGRPGPVHLALATDFLEHASTVEVTTKADRIKSPGHHDELKQAAALMRNARRPILLAGPMFARADGNLVLQHFEAQANIPTALMESPRGLNDPSLGAFAEVLAEADLVVLAGKTLDFTLRFGAPAGIKADATFVVIDPDPVMIERVRRERSSQVAAAIVADADLAVAALSGLLNGSGRATWYASVKAASGYRPAAWSEVRGSTGKLHPIELCRAVQSVLDRDKRSVFISDGGEIGQWAQAGVTWPRRVINGVAGSIGASIPFALAARCVEPKAPVIAVMGDGTFGFHMAEFDTAVRYNLPFVAVVGNDARWNAEHQIQLRDFGAGRAHGCTLLPTRYDQVVAALGGHGELVTRGEDLAPALERAVSCGMPACVNVMIDGLPAPKLQRPAAR